MGEDRRPAMKCSGCAWIGPGSECASMRPVHPGEYMPMCPNCGCVCAPGLTLAQRQAQLNRWRVAYKAAHGGRLSIPMGQHDEQVRVTELRELQGWLSGDGLPKDRKRMLLDACISFTILNAPKAGEGNALDGQKGG